MKLVLIGSPGAGKGTQAKVLSKSLAIAHISTGDLLRNEMNLKTEIGLKITDMMNNGELVPTEIVCELLVKRIKEKDCGNGYILDGFPRNVEQAEMLEDITGSLDRVVYINVADDIIVERMSGRRSCQTCGQMYHVKYNSPMIDGICDNCNTVLIQRPDDSEETVKHRLSVFRTATAPVISYYKDKGLLLEVDGTGAINEISNQMLNLLGAAVEN